MGRYNVRQDLPALLMPANGKRRLHNSPPLLIMRAGLCANHISIEITAVLSSQVHEIRIHRNVLTTAKIQMTESSSYLKSPTFSKLTRAILTASTTATQIATKFLDHCVVPSYLTAESWSNSMREFSTTLCCFFRLKNLKSAANRPLLTGRVIWIAAQSWQVSNITWIITSAFWLIKPVKLFT